MESETRDPYSLLSLFEGFDPSLGSAIGTRRGRKRVIDHSTLIPSSPRSDHLTRDRAQPLFFISELQRKRYEGKETNMT
jgi:hypothetical protein